MSEAVNINHLAENPVTQGVEFDEISVISIPRESLSPNIQALCDILGAKIQRLNTGDAVVTDITFQTARMNEIVNSEPETFDFETAHILMQRLLLETMYPNSQIAYSQKISSGDHSKELITRQKGFSNDRRKTVFFASHDDDFSISCWHVSQK